MRRAIKRDDYKLIILICSIIIISCLKASPLQQTDLTTLTNDASLILSGKVTDIQYSWDDNHRFIYTYVTVLSDRTIKGTLQNNTVTIKHLGGVVGDTRLKLSIGPEFDVGEDVILFLEPNADSTFNLVGGVCGKFVIMDRTIVENQRLNINLPLEIILKNIEVLLENQ